MTLLLHAVFGLVAVVFGTVEAGWSLAAALGRTPKRIPLWIAPAAVAVQFVFGLLLYPAYRVQVRAADLDRSAPALVQLFDFKEHMAALSLVLIAGAALAARDEKLQPPQERWPAAAMACSAAVFLWLAAIVGFVVTSRHSV